MDNGRVLQMGQKKKEVPVHIFVVLLTNGETVEIEAESYYNIGDDEGNPIHFCWSKDKVTVLQLDASDIQAVVSKEHADWESILAAVKKKKRTTRAKK